MYLSSSNIRVFPTAKRESGRRFTEKNLISIMTSVVDKDTFIIKDSDFKFVMHGYYFESTKTAIQDLFPSATQIWAHIKLTTSTDPEYVELDGQDNASSEYEGLYLASAEDISYTYRMQLFDKSSGSWEVVTDNYQKIDPDSIIDDKIIDGGQI